MSMHLYFDADLTAFRTTFRMDGQSQMQNPIAPAKGGQHALALHPTHRALSESRTLSGPSCPPWFSIPFSPLCFPQETSMQTNTKGSETLSILATIDPACQAAGTVTAAWGSVANFHAFLAVVETGVLGAAATLDKIQQAAIKLRLANLDSNNGFAFLRLSLTVELAASIVAGKFIGVHPRHATAAVC